MMMEPFIIFQLCIFILYCTHSSSSLSFYGAIVLHKPSICRLGGRTKRISTRICSSRPSSSSSSSISTSISSSATNNSSSSCAGSSSTRSFMHKEEEEETISSIAFNGEKLIHWRGEKSHGNSLQFRRAEFESCMLTILNSDNNENGHEKQIKFVYTNALSTQNLEISTTHDMSDYQTETFTNSMQYVHIYEINNDSREEGKETELLLHVSKQDWIKAIQRCSLIRGLYEIVAEGDTYNELIQNSLELNSLHDLMVPDGVNVNSTWRVRLRQYGITAASSTKSKQYGKNMRSPMTQEREAVNQLKDLLIQFGGAVDLKDANVSIYVLEGLMGINPKSSSSQQNPNLKTLARLLIKGGGGQSGLATSSIAPNTRICVTNTPLAPIEAFTLCNVARIRNGDRVLDPFAGSCTTLLAASMLCNDCQSVGIEIAYDSQVNKTNILEDFNVRNLTKPQVIIRGDAMDEEIREKARLAVGNQPFDCIVTDPPYGIREKKGYCEDPPLVDLVNKIAQDRHQNKRLLKKFGRLVAFVPNPKGEDVALGMPSKEALDRAGLELSLMVEQPLNDSLSRWLVAYECIR